MMEFARFLIKGIGKPIKRIEMKEKVYSKKYYGAQSKGSLNSANETIPVILQYINPRSIVDVGCGIGTWLKVWMEKGVTDVLGIDGDYVSTGQLLIDRSNFLATDLEKPITVARHFELAMSLEVAEHIKPEFARTFITSLCSLSNVVLFSAAVPNQGGALHYNEQYPDYWIGIFNELGYLPYDCIRENIWMNDQIDGCYRQNMLFFVKKEVAHLYQNITKENKKILPVVHPIHFQHKQDIIDSYKKIVRTPIHTAWYFIKRYWNFIVSKFGNGNKDGSRFDGY